MWDHKNEAIKQPTYVKKRPAAAIPVAKRTAAASGAAQAP